MAITTVVDWPGEEIGPHERWGDVPGTRSEQRYGRARGAYESPTGRNVGEIGDVRSLDGFPRRAVGRRGPVSCPDAHAPDLHGSRLTPRGRVVVAVVWLVMAMTAGLMLATMSGESSEAPMVTTKVMVEPGETLWRLAGQVQPGEDRHMTIDAIMSLNGLESAAEIRPGDILLVPVQP